jgi:hypothetical protein
MITEDYVSFETAKLLKEKGFDWEVHRSYLVNDNFFAPADVNDLPDRKDAIRIPTLQMAMKWLREVYKINIEVCLGFDADSELGYFYNPVISDLKNMGLGIETPEFDETEFIVYEEAAEAGIKYCLEKLI